MSDSITPEFFRATENTDVNEAPTSARCRVCGFNIQGEIGPQHFLTRKKVRNRVAYLNVSPLDTMKPFYLFLFATVLLVTGCDTLHWKSYQVSRVSPGSDDAAKLQSILQSVADQTGLKACASQETFTNRLVSYTGSDERSVTDLAAWFYQGDIRIQLYGELGTPPAYRKANRLIIDSMTVEFGPRFSITREPFYLGK